MHIGGFKHVNISFVAIFRESFDANSGILIVNGTMCLRSHPQAFVKDLNTKIGELCNSNNSMTLTSFSHARLN